MVRITSDKVISTILKHDSKVTSYKIALLRAINDLVLTYPDLKTHQRDVAVPLRLLAEFWIAYYWPFVDPYAPILQGQRNHLEGQTRNDMALPALMGLRQQWEALIGGMKNPADGFFVINELRSPRKRANYPEHLVKAYQSVVAAVAKTIEMPVHYAGQGNWGIFDKPQKYSLISEQAVAVPGTQLRERCLVIPYDLWATFRQVSLWVEALCIHEWCLFTERVADFDRGAVYSLLTSRPDNRRPLTWERNQIDLLIMEDAEFTCPWTEKPIRQGVAYDLDHILPIAVYPTNELWNLVRANAYSNDEGYSS